MLPALYIDHLVFRVEDLVPTEKFYTALFGDPIAKAESWLVYPAGETQLFFTLSTKPTRPYDKEQPGLNHIALGTGDPAQLRAIAAHLDTVGIKHSGIGIDAHGKKEYIWLNDPDGFRLEFYCRPSPENPV